MARDYVFTSWEQPIIDNEQCKYWIWGRERCPETDREHYQGFIVFKRTHRIPNAKRILGGGDGVHLEPRRGTRQQAVDYCRKDGDVTEWGVFEQLTFDQLFKQDLNFLKENYPAFFCRYHKGLALLKSSNVAKWRDVDVNVIWGPTGTFKTRRVMEMDDVYKLDPPYTWFDGYFGESILLIDDYKKGAINRGQLLNLCDGYKLRLETKGAHTWASWKTVYITSNFSPDGWACDALKRRITTYTFTSDV